MRKPTFGLRDVNNAINQYQTAQKGKKYHQKSDLHKVENKNGWTKTTTQTFRGADGQKYTIQNVKDSKGGNKTFISFTTKQNYPVILTDNDSDGKFDVVNVGPRPNGTSLDLKYLKFTSTKDNGVYDKESTTTINLLTGKKTVE